MNYTQNFLFNTNNKYKIIKSFKEITFDDDTKPLVICDIDYTLIKCSISMERIYQIIKEDNDFLNIEDNNLETTAIYWRKNAYTMGFIKQTDPEGFIQMNNTIKELGGKLIFLTARGIGANQKTINDLIKIGIDNPEQYEIHYTNAEITKGEYIKNHDIIKDYKHITFIDDYISYLDSVSELFPQINCYLFNCS